MERKRPPDPLTRKRPARPVFAKEITSGEIVYRFAVVKPDITDDMASAEVSARLVALYVTGEGEEGLQEFPLESEEPIELSQALLQTSALLARILRQTDAGGEACDVYTVEQVIALSLTDSNAYEALFAFVQEVKEGKAKN